MNANTSSSISDAFRVPRPVVRGGPIRRSSVVDRAAVPATPAPPPAPTKAPRQRYRAFTFTLNNYTPEEYTWLTITFPEVYTPRYMIIGKETGENGTPHLQGAVCLGAARDFTTVKAWPGFRRAHLEQMRGTALHNKIYCSKQDPHPFEFGDIPKPGKRTELNDAVEAINNGQSLRQLALGDHGVAVVKFNKGLTVLRSLRSAPRDPSKPPKIYWLYGETGTGKTRCAWELGTLHAGTTDDVWMSNGTLQWFDGYDGQRVAILDDFRAVDCKFNWLLRLTDRYPLQVPFKGGFVNWAPEIIFITGPHDVNGTFVTRLANKPESLGQLVRRLTGIFSLPDDEPRLKMLFAPPKPMGLNRAMEILRGSESDDDEVFSQLSQESLRRMEEDIVIELSSSSDSD